MKEFREIMTKEELVREMAKFSGLTQKDAKLALDAFVMVVRSALADGKTVHIRKFGKFYVRTRKPRTIKHPRTREPIDIPAKLVPAFKPSKILRIAVT